MAGMETDGIPFVPECEVLHQGGGVDECKALFESCEKNPGHNSFIPVKEFGPQHLPDTYLVKARLQEIMEGISMRCDLTVKVIVNNTSPHRPDFYEGTTAAYPYSHLKGKEGISRCGTGYILIDSPSFKIQGKPCPCHPCRDSGSPNMTYWKFRLGTATHVIFDEFEATSSVFECFYDSEDREGVEFLYGYNVSREDDPIRRANTDLSIVTVVTHNEELVKRFEDICRRMVSFPYLSGTQNLEALIISHPHGCSKRISLGNVLHFNLPKGTKIQPGVPYPLDHIPHMYHLFVGLENDNDSDHATNSYKIESPEEQEPLFKFNSKTTFSLPSTASYIYRYPYPLSDTAVSFPPETSFNPPLSNGEVITPPTSAKVYWRPENNNDKLYDCFQYITYNTCTCAGTSGAAIHMCHEKDRNTHILHCGALKEGSNRSGLSKLYSSIKNISVTIAKREREENIQSVMILQDREERRSIAKRRRVEPPVEAKENKMCSLQ